MQSSQSAPVLQSTASGNNASSSHNSERPRGDNHPKDGTSYVSEYLNHRVQILNSHNVRLGFIGSRGHGDGEFEYPEDVALNADDSLYVVDSGNHRICKFDHDYKQSATIGRYGTEEGEFKSPRTILIDSPSGTIYISDTMNHRVQLFSSKHHFMLALGEKGNGA
jgi:DNA-binding beta-propeller fold protein YncE